MCSVQSIAPIGCGTIQSLLLRNTLLLAAIWPQPTLIHLHLGKLKCSSTQVNFSSPARLPWLLPQANTTYPPSTLSVHYISPPVLAFSSIEESPPPQASASGVPNYPSRTLDVSGRCRRWNLNLPLKRHPAIIAINLAITAATISFFYLDPPPTLIVNITT